MKDINTITMESYQMKIEDVRQYLQHSLGKYVMYLKAAAIRPAKFLPNVERRSSRLGVKLS